MEGAPHAPPAADREEGWDWGELFHFYRIWPRATGKITYTISYSRSGSVPGWPVGWGGPRLLLYSRG